MIRQRRGDVVAGSDDFKQIGRDVAKAVDYATEYTAQDLWGNMAEESPVDHGRLAGSWQLQRQARLQWMVYTAVKYAAAVYTGTGIYGPKKKPIVSSKPGRTIRAKNAQALRFEVGGQVIYRKSVKQPRAPLVFESRGKTVYAMSIKGQRPNRYIDRAVNRTNARLDEFAQMGIRKAGLN